MPIVQKIAKLLSRPDFRQNPPRAIWRRMFWRARWRLRPDRPLVLPLPYGGLRVLAPKSGAGALIYYQGFSEPDTAAFLLCYLQPGMVFMDVGAHIGEYVLLAAKRVGVGGECHAFEPQPEVFGLLTENVRMNELQGCTLNPIAVFNSDGEIEFEINEEPSISAICSYNTSHTSTTTITVPTIRLDTYWAGKARKIDLIKIDVEGAELFALQGAQGLLSRSSIEAPVIIFEYAEHNTMSFGYQGRRLLSFLREFNYTIFYYDPSKGSLSLTPVSTHLPRGIPSTVNLIATKDVQGLVDRLREERAGEISSLSLLAERAVSIFGTTRETRNVQARRMG